MSRTIYADNAATTQIRPEVLEIVNDAYKYYGNPSSLHSLGRKAKSLIEESRESILNTLHSKNGKLYFTSGGTESNNLAIKGFALANNDKGNHIITSAIEHPSVMQTAKYLQNNGYEVTYLNVDKDGVVDLDQLCDSIRSDTILISIMWANNEIGTIQPIFNIGDIAKKHNICFHTDAVQVIESNIIDVDSCGIDMLSFSAHKFYGPKGIGGLYVSKNAKINPQIHGGKQEFMVRPGTENLPCILGVSKALELASEDNNYISERLIDMRDNFIEQVSLKILDSKLNGHREKRLPGNANFSFAGIDGEALLLLLNSEGICVSSGSACSSGSPNSSYVIKAIGVDDELAHGTIRFSFGRYNTANEIDYIVTTLVELVDKLRWLRS